jgi:uncharacterized protein YbaP (TraB family)
MPSPERMYTMRFVTERNLPLFFAAAVALFIRCGIDKNPSAPSEYPVSGENHLLWEISGNAMSAPSYLFGTIHLICPSDLFDQSTFVALFRRVDQLILEVDVTDSAQMSAFDSIAYLPPGRTLSSYYSPEEAAVIDSFFVSMFGVPITELDSFHPYLLSSLILMTLPPCYNVVSYEEVCISQFFSYSPSGIVVGLETAQFQLDMMELDSFQMHADDLYGMVQTYDEGALAYEYMLQLYRAQKVDSLYMLSVFGDPGTAAAMLDDRNAAWMTRIPGLIANRPSFIAVGSAHLGGPNGLLELLSATGYRLTPVQLTGGLSKKTTVRENPGFRRMADIINRITVKG